MKSMGRSTARGITMSSYKGLMISKDAEEVRRLLYSIEDKKVDGREAG